MKREVGQKGRGSIITAHPASIPMGGTSGGERARTQFQVSASSYSSRPRSVLTGVQSAVLTLWDNTGPALGAFAFHSLLLLFVFTSTFISIFSYTS